MNKFFIGVDGGGTKTAFAISSADAVTLATAQRSGCSYREIGIDGVVNLLRDGITECLENADICLDQCVGACFGIPCWGENMEADDQLSVSLQKCFGDLPIQLSNDVEVGFAGALENQVGIHLVAGTGSIAYGKDGSGNILQCGGWNEFFGDEGSCYWIGREAMGLFSKEADGRVPRGPLYQIIKAELPLKNDLSFIDYVLQNFVPHRESVAAFQKYAYQAAQQGDVEAQNLYVRAAFELAQMAVAIKNQLSFENTPVIATYSGGLFHVGDLILDPLRAQLEKENIHIQPASGTPLEGALRIAINNYTKGDALL